MRSLPSNLPLSEALITGKNALIAHNPDEEMGFAGKRNTDLIADIRKYDCRSVPTIHRHTDHERIVVVPSDCERIVRDTVAYLRGELRIPDLLHPDSIRGIRFEEHDSMFMAIMKRSRSELEDVLQTADSLSYTMHSREVQAFKDIFRDIDVPGDLIVSEMFNNKAIAVGICHALGIRAPQSCGAFSREDAKKAYITLKNTCALPLIVKGGRSASGFASRIVHSDEDFERVLDELSAYLEEDGYPVRGITHKNAVGIVIQEYVQHMESSPGGALIVGGARPFTDHTFVGITDQLLNERNEHMGNVHYADRVCDPDLEAQMRSMLERAADCARHHGGAGMMLCADFVVANENGKRTAFLVEFNMRMSAQYGGLAMSHHLLGTTQPHDRSYFVGNIPLASPLPEGEEIKTYATHLRGNGAAFDRETNTGVLPLNLTIDDSVQGVIFGKNKHEIDALREVARM